MRPRSGILTVDNLSCLQGRRHLKSLPRVGTRSKKRDGPGQLGSWRQDIFEFHHHGIRASTLAHRESLSQATVGGIYSQFTELRARMRQGLDCPRVFGIDEYTQHGASASRPL